MCVQHRVNYIYNKNIGKKLNDQSVDSSAVNKGSIVVYRNIVSLLNNEIQCELNNVDRLLYKNNHFHNCNSKEYVISHKRHQSTTEKKVSFLNGIHFLAI